MKTVTQSWIRTGSIFLLFFVSPFPSWGSSTELIILFDLTGSCSSIIEENKKEVEYILNALPGETCTMIIAVTEKSFSDPLKILNRDCIPASQYTFDTRPFEVKRRMVNEWKKNSQSLGANRPSTDLLGAICLAGLYFSQSRKNGEGRILILFSDMRHNTDGIDLSGVAKIPQDVLSKVRGQGLIARLKGVKVWALGVHTNGKSQHYFEGLQGFWTQYFQESGASLETFSPDSKWSPGNKLKIPE